MARGVDSVAGLACPEGDPRFLSLVPGDASVADAASVLEFPGSDPVVFAEPNRFARLRLDLCVTQGVPRLERIALMNGTALLYSRADVAGSWTVEGVDAASRGDPTALSVDVVPLGLPAHRGSRLVCRG